MKVKKTFALTSDEVTLFDIPYDCKELVQVLERQGNLVLVMTKMDYIKKWRESELKKETMLPISAESLQEINTRRCPVDIFDSGIVFYIATAEDGVQTATIVRKMDDLPFRHCLDAAIVDRFFAETPDAPVTQLGPLRQWKEGTIILATTLPSAMPNDGKDFFISMRKRLDCTTSMRKEVGIIDMFKQAYKGKDLATLKVPGRTYMFVLAFPENQQRDDPEIEPTLYHLRTYAFGDGKEYREVAEIPSGVQKLPALSLAEAKAMVEDGKVVMTMNPFYNTKVMTSDT
ncbi:MAG: hypothetical protein ACMG6E_03580, partial [Candidatus Roizmanbacteria bacterium]